jgi:hypothetical protein
MVRREPTIEKTPGWVPCHLRLCNLTDTTPDARPGLLTALVRVGASSSIAVEVQSTTRKLSAHQAYQLV